MYTKHIDVKNNLVFLNEKDAVEIDLSYLPNDILFYIENEKNWWVERSQIGREKNNDIKHIVSKIYEKAEILLQERIKNENQIMTDYSKKIESEAEPK